jgi:hypothetical protein
VLAPSLRGLDLMVDPGAVQACYGAEPTWQGLGLLAYAIVPTTGPSIPRPRRPSGWLPATAPKGWPTKRCATAKPSSSTLEDQPLTD